MKQFLILQHTTRNSVGSTRDWLDKNKFSYDILRACDFSSMPLPSVLGLVDQYQSLILTGGYMNVDEEHLHPWLTIEKELIKKFLHRADRKILGICLGAQLLAEALGSRVEKHRHWEVGFHDINLHFQDHTLFDFDGVSMSTADSASSVLKAFQWHGYRFFTPSKAVKLASNEACADQAFIYEDRVLGMQFHPESTKEWILENLKPEVHGTYPEGPYVQYPHEIQSQLHFQEELQRWHFKVLDRFFA